MSSQRCSLLSNGRGGLGAEMPQATWFSAARRARRGLVDEIFCTSSACILRSLPRGIARVPSSNSLKGYNGILPCISWKYSCPTALSYLRPHH
jgi:hypothetical protein